jgi:50S ribosomal subunit-associated GTPase HflX
VLDEVRQWNATLPGKIRLLVATKRDVVGEPDWLPGLTAEARARGLEVLCVSAVTGAGVEDLKRRMLHHVAAARATEEEVPL